MSEVSKLGWPQNFLLPQKVRPTGKKGPKYKKSLSIDPSLT
jgi:hypothetical protein